jgi:hypothetical protein
MDFIIRKVMGVPGFGIFSITIKSEILFTVMGAAPVKRGSDRMLVTALFKLVVLIAGLIVKNV